MTARKKAPANAWKKGQSGNPAGKPKGVRNNATSMVLALMEGGAKQITEAVIKAAKGGDLAAARLVIERLAPPARERPISITFPDTSTAKGISDAQQVVLNAVGEGELMPGEANVLSGILEARRKAFETQELSARLDELERKVASK